jgi:undecaprenyl-phosphate 4-deoxy-4-formamido-L-arabinose transferase
MLGVIIFALGLLGEYIGRIYQQVRARPRYLVQTVLEARPGDVPPIPATGAAPAAQAAPGTAAPDAAWPTQTQERDR